MTTLEIMTIVVAVYGLILHFSIGYKILKTMDYEYKNSTNAMIASMMIMLVWPAVYIMMFSRKE